MDENSIKELLNKEIAEQIRTLSTLESGSKEKSIAIDDLTQLYKLKIEEDKNERDADEKSDRRTMEDFFNARDHDIKSAQIAEQVKDRYFKLGIAAAELMIPLIFYGVWMKKGFKFEETGTYTSTTFRGLFSRFRPTKR